MPVYQPSSLDVDTIVGVAITLLMVLAVQIATWHRERRQNSAALRAGGGRPVPAAWSRRNGVGGRASHGASEAPRLPNARAVVPYRVDEGGPEPRGGGVKRPCA